MSNTLQSGPDLQLAGALDALVARGTITQEQQAAILAEVARHPTEIPAPPERGITGFGPARGQVSDGTGAEIAGGGRRRTLSEVLVEVGLYVGSALVLAAAVVLVAQSWEDLTKSAQVTILGATALVTGIAGVFLARGATLGSARRRLAGVVLVGTAATAAGTVALLIGDSELAGVVALSVALAVMVVAQLLASSAVTEIGLFVAAYALLQVTAEWLRPPVTPRFDQYGQEIYEATTFDRMLQFGGFVFGMFWALGVARRLLHKELAVGLGVAVAFMSAMPLAGEPPTRPLGLVALALLASVGFWRFMVEGRWPWLAGAVASVTAFVFWLVGGAQQPALAILVAGLVLLGSSALGMQVARRRRARATTTAPPA